MGEVTFGVRALNEFGSVLDLGIDKVKLPVQIHSD